MIRVEDENERERERERERWAAMTARHVKSAD